MWILLRKNLWMWRPPRSANCFILAIALAFSLADWLWDFPAGAWAFACIISILVAQAGGSSALDVDLKHDNVLFLECLPVRWWQVWLANWLDQLLMCLLIVPLLCWHRVLTWTPPPEMSTRHLYRGGGEDLLFHSRWLLPAGLAAGIYFAFSYALLWRTFFKSDKAALLPTYVGSIAYVMLPLTMPAILMVAPGLWDLWPLVVFQGTVFSVCGLLAFAGPPRYWSRWRKFSAVGVPLLVMAFIIEISAVWYTCRRCEKLNWSEPGLTYWVAPDAAGNGRWFTAQVSSPSSGSHHFALDMRDGASVYVGRNLQFSTAETAARDDMPLIVFSGHPPISWWPFPSPVFLIQPDGSGKTELLKDRYIVDERGNRFEVYEARWVGKRGLVAILGRSAREVNQCVFLIDQSGRTVRRFDVPPDSFRFLVSPAGRILTVVPSEVPSHGSKSEHILYRLYDTTTDQESRFELPGRALCFSDDLGEVACLQAETRQGVAHQSIVIAGLLTRKSRPLIEEGVLAPVPEAELTDRSRYSDPLPRQLKFAEETYSLDSSLMRFDREFRQAVLVVDRYEGAAVYSSLVYADLKKSAHRILVPEGELSPRGVSSMRRGFEMLGFSPGGGTFVYRSGKKLAQINLATGKAAITAIPDEESGRVELSPAGRRILTCIIDKRSESPDNTWKVFDAGGAAPLCTISDARTVQWLDDDHLVVTREHELSIVDLAGPTVRRILPPADGAFSKK